MAFEDYSRDIACKKLITELKRSCAAHEGEDKRGFRGYILTEDGTKTRVNPTDEVTIHDGVFVRIARPERKTGEYTYDGDCSDYVMISRIVAIGACDY